jgi:hypothetical protein
MASMEFYLDAGDQGGAGKSGESCPPGQSGMKDQYNPQSNKDKMGQGSGSGSMDQTGQGSQPGQGYGQGGSTGQTGQADKSKSEYTRDDSDTGGMSRSDQNQGK